MSRGKKCTSTGETTTKPTRSGCTNAKKRKKKSRAPKTEKKAPRAQRHEVDKKITLAQNNVPSEASLQLSGHRMKTSRSEKGKRTQFGSGPEQTKCFCKAAAQPKRKVGHPRPAPQPRGFIDLVCVSLKKSPVIICTYSMRETALSTSHNAAQSGRARLGAD